VLDELSALKMFPEVMMKLKANYELRPKAAAAGLHSRLKNK
jgi:hypothetical protein